MSEPTPKLYVLTLLALRGEIQDTKVVGEGAAHSVLTIQTSREAAEAEGWASIRQKFSESDGWFEYQVTAFELPSQIDMDDYHLTLTITKAGGAV